MGTVLAPLLAFVRQHIALQPKDEALVASLVQHRSLRRRQYLVQAGELCKYDNFIVKGSFRAFATSADGYEHVLQLGIEGWWIGDIEAFVNQTPAKLDVEALEAAEVLQLDLPCLERLYQEVPGFERFFRILLQNAFIGQQRRSLALISLGAAARYEQFMATYPTLAQRIPQRHIASYLGLRPEVLSRIRRKAQGTAK